MITTEVAFARSTWRKSKEFSAGLHDLAQRMPMELVRLYVTEGVRTPRVRIDYYDRIDELRALRREALLAEMRHVEAQAECWLEEHPDEAARIAAEHRRRQRRQPRIRLHARDLPDRPQPSRLRAVHVVRRERALDAELAAADLRPPLPLPLSALAFALSLSLCNRPETNGTVPPRYDYASLP